MISCMPAKETSPDSLTRLRYYLDWASTAIPDYSGENPAEFANPSSLHAEGRLARRTLEDARERCAEVLGVPAKTLYFTSGGTEANALALHSMFCRTGKERLLYSDIEHPSVRENCLLMKKRGMPTGIIKVESDGRVRPETFARALAKNSDTRFVTIMGANNETGAVMEIPELVGELRSLGKAGQAVHFHSDLVQAAGKIPLDLSGWGVDSASFSAHKLGGPRGIGLLYAKSPPAPLYSGGGQERGVRHGTENVFGAVAFAEVLMCRAAPEAVRCEAAKTSERMKYLISRLQTISRCRLIPEDRRQEDERFSPWILQVGFNGVPGEVMVRALDDAGIAVSTGSACSSTSALRPALQAMGLSHNERLEGIRISQGWSTQKADMDALLIAIEKALSFL